MSGAEFVAVIGAISSVITIVESCHKITKIIRQGPNEFLKNLEPHIDLLAHDIQQLRRLDLRSPRHIFLNGVLGGCKGHLEQLTTLIEEYKEATNTNVPYSKRFVRAPRASKLQRDIQNTWTIIREYRSTITLHLAVHNSINALPAPNSDTKGLFGLPPRNDKHFRRQNVLDTILHAIRNGNSQSCILSIFGIGGVGKTQIALDLCYQVQHQYSVVVWIRADSDVSITESITRFANLLSKGGRSLCTMEDSLTFIKTVAKTRTRPWFFVFDNYGSTALPSICSAVMDGCQQDVVLTTQRDKPSWGSAIEIPPMSEDDGLQLLLRDSLLSLGPDDLNSARHLVRDLGGLPLAVAQMAAYLNSSGKPIHNVLQEFLGTQHTLSLTERQRQSSYSSSLDDSFKLAFQEIRIADTNLFDFLLQLSIFDPDGVNESLFQNYFLSLRSRGDYLPGYYTLFCRNGEWSSEQFLDATMRLSAFYVIQMSSEQDTLLIQMHRLTQGALLKSVDQSILLREIFRAAAILSASLSMEDWEGFSLSYRRLLLGNVRQWVDMRTCHIKTPSHVRMHSGILEGYQTDMATFLAFNDEEEPAERLLLDALQLQSSELGDSATLTNTTMVSLANLYLEATDLDKAETFTTRLAEVNQQANVSKPSLQLVPLLLCGQLEMRRGELGKALQTFQNCSEFYGTACGAYDLLMSAFLVNGAEILLMQGELEDASQLLYDAQCIAQASTDSLSLTCRVKWNIARLSALKGEYVRAVRNYQDLIEDCKQRFGTQNPRWRTLHCELGDVYRELGIPAKSEDCYRNGSATVARKRRPVKVEPTDISQALLHGCFRGGRTFLDC